MAKRGSFKEQFDLCAGSCLTKNYLAAGAKGTWAPWMPITLVQHAEFQNQLQRSHITS